MSRWYVTLATFFTDVSVGVVTFLAVLQTAVALKQFIRLLLKLTHMKKIAVLLGNTIINIVSSW